MNDKPLVSVILPCYNAEDYLEEAILSILNQTYENIELLILEDGSTDRSSEIIDQFVEKDSRVVKIVNEVNLGLIRTLNKGIELATGDYIARMDSDDISLPNRIKTQISFLLENTKVDIVSAGFRQIDTKGNQFGLAKPVIVGEKAILFVSLFRSPIVHAALVGKKEVFAQHKYSTEDVAVHTEDYELWLRMLKKGVVFENINETLYLYRANPESVSNQHNQLQFQNSLNNSLRNVEEFLGKKIQKETYQLLANKIIYPYSVSNVFSFSTCLRKIKKMFFVKFSVEDREKKEIDRFLASQKIDAFGQIILKGNIVNRIVGIILLLIDPSLYLIKENRERIVKKITKA